MKISHSILILVIALFASQLLSSQNTRFDLNRTIILGNSEKFESNSEIRNVILKVDKKTAAFSLNIACKVQLGILTVEIYDPNGEKQGEFSIESHRKSKMSINGSKVSIFRNPKSENVEGNISKQINEPVKGNWIVKLIPKGAIADINIQSQFINKD